MNKHLSMAAARVKWGFGAAIIVAGVALASCTTTSPLQRQQDIKSCSRKGLAYGSQENFNCMMREKLHRDRNLY